MRHTAAGGPGGGRNSSCGGSLLCFVGCGRSCAATALRVFFLASVEHRLDSSKP